MSEKDSSTEIRARYDQSTGYITNIDLIREQEYPLLKGLFTLGQYDKCSADHRC